jgi:hypothetical protein
MYSTQLSHVTVDGISNTDGNTEDDVIFYMFAKLYTPFVIGHIFNILKEG